MNYIYQLSTNKNLTNILVIIYVFMKEKKIHKENVIIWYNYL